MFIASEASFPQVETCQLDQSCTTGTAIVTLTVELNSEGSENTRSFNAACLENTNPWAGLDNLDSHFAVPISISGHRTLMQ